MFMFYIVILGADSDDEIFKINLNPTSKKEIKTKKDTNMASNLKAQLPSKCFFFK